MPELNKNPEHPFAQYVRILGKGKTGTRSLSYDEAYQAMKMILDGQAEEVQLGAFLMLLRVKEESHQELTGFVRAAKDHIANATTLDRNRIKPDLDWSSYAGKKRQLPWYLLSSQLLAENGINILMHGASGHTAGRIYSADVLEALGIASANSWADVEKQLQETHFCFLPLGVFSPQLQRIIDLRNTLGLRSPVHTLACLLNPLDAPYSLQSIFHPSYGISHQQASLDLGQDNAAVFKGEGGEVERKPEANCHVKLIRNGKAREEDWPRLLSGRQAQAEPLDIDHMRAVWQGKSSDSYGEAALLGTAAIALQLLDSSLSQSA